MTTAANEESGFGAELAQVPSPLGRVWLSFVAPSRAFERLGSGGSWWLPYLLVLLVSLGYGATIGNRVGWDAVTRTNLASSPRQQARFEQLPPEQQGAQLRVIARFTRAATYLMSAVLPLFFAAVVAGLLLATLNFGLGGDGRFGPLFAVYLFSSLPQLAKLLLVILMLFLGGAESFHMNNPLGSNPAFYMQGSGSPRWLVSVLTWVDVFVIWQLAILAIGSAIVAKVSRGKAAAVVLGWTAIFVAAGATFTLMD